MTTALLVSAVGRIICGCMDRCSGQFFPPGKNGPAHSFSGERTDWGEIPVCYTGFDLTTHGFSHITYPAHNRLTYSDVSVKFNHTFDRFE